MTSPFSIHVEAWAPEYGGPLDAGELDEASVPVDPDVEVPAAEWRPLDPGGGPVPACVDFVDGVRRIDARVWITTPEGATRMGICASYAAGVTRCDGSARVIAAEVRRGLFAPAGAPELRTSAGTYAPMAVAGDDIEQLSLGLQQRMGELEIAVAEQVGVTAPRVAAGFARLVVVDGPLSGRQHVPGAIGYVKTHRVAYLLPALAGVVAALRPGQRTPVFVTQTTWSRYSWYLRLPGPAGHPWAGVVRCEAAADLPLADARARADQSARVLPGFASAPHKDPRAPQNLYPIAALERELRRRLGDAAWLYRALRVGANA